MCKQSDQPTEEDLELVNQELVNDGEQPISFEELVELRNELPEEEENA